MYTRHVVQAQSGQSQLSLHASILFSLEYSLDNAMMTTGQVEDSLVMT